MWQMYFFHVRLLIFTMATRHGRSVIVLVIFLLSSLDMSMETPLSFLNRGGKGGGVVSRTKRLPPANGSSSDCLSDACLLSPCPSGNVCVSSRQGCSFSCKPKSEQNLTPPSADACKVIGLQCLRGYCVESTGRGFFCQCEAGFTGVLCNTPCSLKCGRVGKCNVDAVSGQEYCNCPWPWHGPTCTLLS